MKKHRCVLPTLITISMVGMPLLSLAQAIDQTRVPIPELPAAVSDDAPVVAESVGNPETSDRFTVRLHVDGNLVGRLRMLDLAGRETAIVARLDFFRDGYLINSVQTDESGHFQVVGLDPGRYDVIVTVDSARADFDVEVLPYDEDASEEEQFLNALVRLKSARMDPLTGLPLAGHCGGFAGGGCCGHRRGLGWLGLAGLAGLAGLGGDGDGEVPVSPSQP